MGKFSDILLTVDYDRTLTAPDSTVPRRNIEAIRYFMEEGGAFTVNTGRSLPMIRSFRDRIPVNAPLLLYNGSAAYDLREEAFLFSHEIHLPMQEVVQTCLRELPEMVLEVQARDAHYGFREDPMWEALCDRCGCPWGSAAPGDDLGPFLKFTLYGQIRTPVLSDLFEADEEDEAVIRAAMAKLRALFGDHVEVFRSAARILDVHTRGVSKLRSARELQTQLGRKTLVCVGDGENDVNMLSGADFSWCPADAVVADRYENVCRCADGAVADVIYQKIPEII